MVGMMQIHHLESNMNLSAINYDKHKYWIFSNILGMAIFLISASLMIWPTSAELAIPLDSRESTTSQLAYVMFVFIPTAIIFLIVNITWFVTICVDLFSVQLSKEKNWWIVLIWIIICVAWIGVISYDIYRSRQCTVVQYSLENSFLKKTLTRV